MLPDDSWVPLADPEEPLGSKTKEWVRSKVDESTWLLKYARPKSGEYWAECVVHALACLIGVPSACIRPACRTDENAILSRSVLRDGERLEHGKELLSRVLDCGYDSDKGDDNPDYTVQNVQRSLDGVRPPDATTAFMSGFDVWAGYLVLDAWVAATDRHHENWAIATNTAGDRRLAESFDHGSALGFSLSERQLASLQEMTAIERWTEKGTTHFCGRPSMTEVACQALKRVSGGAAEYWLARLADARQTDIDDIVCAVPSPVMSDHRRRVVLGILKTNRERILSHGCCH